MAAVPVDLPPSYLSTGIRRVMDHLGAQLLGRLVLRFVSPFSVTDVPATADAPAHTRVGFGPVPTTWTPVEVQSGGYQAGFGEFVPMNGVSGEVICTLPLITADDVGRRVCVTADPCPSGNPVRVKGQTGQPINTQLAPDLDLGINFISIVVVAQFEASAGFWRVESLSVAP